jgi:hypothetical protein
MNLFSGHDLAGFYNSSAHLTIIEPSPHKIPYLIGPFILFFKNCTKKDSSIDEPY